MNIMQDVSKALGIELDKEFTIEQLPSHRIFILTKHGVTCRVENTSLYCLTSNSDTYLARLCTGEYSIGITY